MTNKCHKTTKRGTTKNAPSKVSAAKSLQARKQKRNRDGTFAKGFKSHASPVKKTSGSSTKKTINISKKTKGGKTATVRKPVSKGKSKGIQSGKRQTPKEHAIEKAFDFQCTGTMKKKVIKTVSENFTKEEIDMIGSQGKLIVKNRPDKSPEKGGYNRKETHFPNESVEISLKKDAGESTITHEIIHHLRTVDPNRKDYAKTAYPVDKKGIADSKKTKAGPISKDSISNAEETATVAETEIRTKNSSDHISDYWDIDKKGIYAKQIRDSDRKTMRETDRGVIPEGDHAKGERAVGLVNKNYPKTIVSSRKVGGETALNTYRRIINKRRKRQW